MVNIPNTSNPCLEAIAFQTKSTLGIALTKVFQKVIDFRDSLEYDDYLETNLEAQRDFRVDRVYKYCTKVMKYDFIRCLKEVAGIEVREFTLYGGLDQSVNFFFAVDCTMDDITASLENRDRSAGTGSSMYTTDREAVEEMKSISDLIDLDKSRITATRYGDDRRIYCKIYFDVNAAFLMHDFFAVADMEPFTAREIAAIMLHETGHVMTIFEHMGDAYAMQRRLCDYKRLKLTDSKSAGEFLTTAATTLIPMFQQLTNKLSGNNDPIAKLAVSTSSVTASCLNAAQHLYSEYNSDKDGSWITTKAGNYVINVLCMLASLFLSLLSDVAFLMVLVPIWQSLAKWNEHDFNSDGRKAGDQRITSNNLFLVERWADEFATRHGFGADLSSALNKIQYAAQRATIEPVYTAYVRHSRSFNLLMTAFVWLQDKITLGAYCDPVIYEVNYKRNKRILQNAYGFFRQNIDKLPPELVSQWLNDIDRMVELTNESKTASDTKVGSAFWRAFILLNDPVDWAKHLKNNDLNYDYTILFDQLDDLHNNPLYAQSARLKMLGKRNKHK